MKRIFCLIFTVFTVCWLRAQGTEVVDTIEVASLQSFNVPSVGVIVYGNVLKFDFTAELLDEGKRKIKDIDTYSRKPAKEDMAKATQGGRGTAIWLVVHERIEKPGTYFVKISINMSGEMGGLKKDRYYMIVVSHPTLAAPISLRDKYFFGEKEAFSFATVDYANPTLYSYEILDGSSVVIQGTGPVVYLDSVLKNTSLVKKTITVRGMYMDKPFSFINPLTKEVQNAEWNFSIDQPSLERFNSWQTKPDENWRLFVDNESITPTRTFLYAYIGRTPGGFAVTTPEILGLRVSSDPENFIAGQTQRQSGSFRVVEIKVNQDFLDQMQVGAEQQVKIKISFRTQFGEPVNDEFHAVIIR